MNSRIRSITPEFVELMPPRLEPGLLYISLEYRVTKHLCACGCGQPIVLPLHPGQWRFSYDGENVSLAPSVGNDGLDCRSHYWIRNGRIDWHTPLTLEEGRKGRVRDQAAVARPTQDHKQTRRRWWQRHPRGAQE